MANQKNQDIVTELKEKISRAKSVVLTDYRGLTHKQSEDLHQAMKKAGGEYVIVKNSLLKIASKGSSFDLKETVATGPIAALLAYEDEIGPLKELTKFIKSLNLPVIKTGIIGGTHYSAAQVESISKLPGKLALQGQLVGQLSSPMYGLLYTLNGNLNKLVYVLSKIKQ